MIKVRKVTLDTNIFAPREIAFLEFLLMWQAKGMVEIAVSTTVLAEINLMQDEKWKAILMDYAGQINLIEATEIDQELLHQVQSLIFPGINPQHKKYLKRIKDIEILAWHIHQQGDILVTRDRHFLQHHDKIKSLWHTSVLTPELCRNFLAG